MSVIERLTQFVHRRLEARGWVNVRTRRGYDLAAALRGPDSKHDGIYLLKEGATFYIRWIMRIVTDSTLIADRFPMSWDFRANIELFLDEPPFNSDRKGHAVTFAFIHWAEHMLRALGQIAREDPQERPTANAWYMLIAEICRFARVRIQGVEGTKKRESCKVRLAEVYMVENERWGDGRE